MYREKDRECMQFRADMAQPYLSYVNGSVLCTNEKISSDLVQNKRD